MGEHCSDREQRAEAAERELTKLKLLVYMSDRIGEEMEAVVTGVEDFGLFAQGINLPAEGLIRVSALADDYYTFDRASHTLTGRRSGNSLPAGRSDSGDRRPRRYRPPRTRFPTRPPRPAAGEEARSFGSSRRIPREANRAETREEAAVEAAG